MLFTRGRAPSLLRKLSKYVERRRASPCVTHRRSTVRTVHAYLHVLLRYHAYNINLITVFKHASSYVYMELVTTTEGP